MDKISNNIYAHYRQTFSQLPFDKQFHFASRLYLWDQDEWASKKLVQLRQEFTAANKPDAALQQVRKVALSSPLHGSKNASELRRPYFELYPNLKLYVSLLFRTLFLETIYGYDARDIFLQLCPPNEVEQLVEDLLNDPAALAILSTHAVNFLYLYSRLFTPTKQIFSPDVFLDVGQKQYDSSDPIHLQLKIYLYTHCVIGESMFYYRPLPANTTGVYISMMKELESLIDASFEDINLDNKYEFLVCSQIAGFQSSLHRRIDAEACRSLSEHGTFLVDRHNNNPQTTNISLDKSEHRNVLCILANRQFSPLAS